MSLIICNGNDVPAAQYFVVKLAKTTTTKWYYVKKKKLIIICGSVRCYVRMICANVEILNHSNSRNVRSKGKKPQNAICVNAKTCAEQKSIFNWFIDMTQCPIVIFYCRQLECNSRHSGVWHLCTQRQLTGALAIYSIVSTKCKIFIIKIQWVCWKKKKKKKNVIVFVFSTRNDVLKFAHTSNRNMNEWTMLSLAIVTIANKFSFPLNLFEMW